VNGVELLPEDGLFWCTDSDPKSKIAMSLKNLDLLKSSTEGHIAA